MNHAPDHPNANDPIDVAIVGGGPIGIELAVSLQRKLLRSVILEAGSIGNTMQWWAPQTKWFSSNERISIAGVPLLTNDQSKATREEYLTYLRSVVQQFGLAVRTGSAVTAIDQHEDSFAITTNGGGKEATVHAKSVVLAIGGTDFPNRLGIEGEDLPHVDGYLREPHLYYGRNVLVIGGRNSAIEAALRLHHVGAKVTLCYRGEGLPESSIKYWLLPEINGLMQSGRIKTHFGTKPIKITGDEVVLQHADGQVTTVVADDVLSLIGYGQNKELFCAAGVELIGEMQRPVFDEQTMETNVPGIFVAGTAVAGTQSSKYKTFLENCHVHVDRIAAHLTGNRVQHDAPVFEKQVAIQPES